MFKIYNTLKNKIKVGKINKKELKLTLDGAYNAAQEKEGNEIKSLYYNNIAFNIWLME